MLDVKILLADDERKEATDIKHILESLGYKVPYIAFNSEDLVEKALELMPDLILMNTDLKGDTDGVEAASKIKYLSIPVIYLTSNSDEATFQRALETEPHGYLLKPFDLTQLRFNIEMALHKNDKYKDSDEFRLMTETIDDIIYMVDLQRQRIIYLSPASEKITGWKNESFYKNQDLWIDMILPEDRSKVMSYISETKDAHNREKIEYRIRTHDGEVKWFSTDFKLLSSEKGEPLKVIGHATDITLQKESEIQLKKSEKKYRNIFENSGVLLLIFDDEGNIIMFNSEWERVSGYSRQEVEGKMKWMDFVHPDYLQKMLDYHHQRMKDPESAPHQYESVFIHKSGEKLVMCITVTAVPGTENWLVSALDITELKKAEDALIRSEEFNRSIIASSPDCIKVLDLEGNLLFMSDSGQKLMEVDDLTSILNINLINFYEEEYRPDARAAISSASKGDVARFRGYCPTLKGTPKWWDVIVAPVLDADGKPEKLSAVSRDITDSIKAEESLRESEGKYRAIMDYSSDAIFLADLDGNFVDCNKKAENLLGYSKDEILKLNFIDIHPPEELEKVTKDFKTSISKDMGIVETVVLTKDNQKVPVAITSSLIEYGDKKVLQGVFRDITERKKVEKALQESEEKYKTLFQSDPNYTILIKPDGVLLDVNTAAERIIGQDKDELVGKNFHELGIFPKKDLELHSEMFSYALKQGKVAPYRARIIDKYGKIRWVLNEASAIMKDNKLDYVLVIGMDITDYKKAEDKLKESAERFRAVAESAVDAIVTTDQDGNIILFNDSLTKIFGYKKVEMSGKPLTILMPERYKKDYLDELEKFKRSGEHRLIGRTVVTTGLRKDGTEFPFEMSLAVWRSGEKTYFTSIIRDITKQKISEEQTKEHLEKLTIINKVINTANNASDIPNLLRDVLKSTMELLGFESGGIYLLEKNTRYAMLEHHENLPEKFIEKIRRIKIDNEPFSTVYIKGNAIYDFVEIKPDLEMVSGFKTLAAVPLFSAGKVIGSLNVSSTEKTSINELKKDVLEAIGMQTGTVIAKMYSEEAIKDSLRAKEVLIKEIHHRVKNNLQIISSLLDLQESYVKDDQTAVNVLMESQNRVLSMAMIHEMLYQSEDLSSIDFSIYIRNLVFNLSGSYGIINVDSKISVEDVFLNMETSIPLGLIISELVSNSFKYAFPENKPGELNISLKNKDKHLELIIEDDGIGFPEDVDFRNIESSLGLRLVNSLVNQLDGTIELDRSHGTKFTITFKELKYKKRI